MSSAAGIRPFSSVNRFVDRAIGADDLQPTVREKLLRQQLRSVGQLTPAMLACTIVVSSVFLWLSFGTVAFWPMVVAIGCTNLVQGLAAYLAWRDASLSDENASRLAVRTVLYAVVLGVLWGTVFVLLPISDSAVRSAATIGAGGVLCVSMLALLNYPQALAAFIIPMVVCLLGTMTRLGGAPEFWVEYALLMAFIPIMARTTFSHAANFVGHHASEARLQDKREIIGLLLGEFDESTSDWIWGVDAAGRINRISGGFSTATGLTEDALIGADFVHFMQCVTPSDDPLVATLESDIAAHETFQDIELMVTAGGADCWWSLTGTPTYNDAGVYTGYIGTGSDITDRKLAERRITMLAHHDPMTGLLNRTKFTEQLNSCVARLERYGTPFSVMFLDLDQFKSVNDSHGHQAGDRLLVQMAKRILDLVHEPDLAARLGGDEFAIILPNSADVDTLSRLATMLIDEAIRPFSIDGLELSVGMSIGIAMAPLNGTRADQILRNADLALYRAKSDGRCVYRFFESEMDIEARERRLLEVELREAVSKGELALYYQPVVAAGEENVVGFEALVRWKHPSRGLIKPSTFIPVAEHSSLIVDIGDWTIEQACMEAASWPEQLSVAVNLSAKHFRRSDIARVIKRALAASGLAPRRLGIEITESLLMEDPDEVVVRLREIRALGVTIAMDDFGTGYSSLSYLLKFPFDKIKIDRSFVHSCEQDDVARDTLKAIASLGRTLKLTITAEGVETRAEADFLAGIACQQLQGYFFGRPLDRAGMADYLLTLVPGRAEEVKAQAEQRLSIAGG